MNFTPYPYPPTHKLSFTWNSSVSGLLSMNTTALTELLFLKITPQLIDRSGSDISGGEDFNDISGSDETNDSKRQRIEPTFTHICSVDGNASVKNSDDVIFELKDNVVVKTHFKSFLDYYSIKFELTLKCIKIKEPLRQFEWIYKSFNNPEKSDIRFRVERRTGQNRFDTIFGHKLILSQNSEYFEQKLANDWSDSNEIEVTAFSYEAYYQYLRWLYTDCVDTQDMEVLLEMLSLSEQYLDHDFKAKCVSHLKAVITIENVCSVYSQAIETNAKSLEEFCSNRMAKDIRRVGSTQDFNALDSDVAKHFVKELSERKAKITFDGK